MADFYGYTLRSVTLSLILLIGGFILINVGYSEIADSLIIIQDARRIQENPSNLQLEINNLVGRKTGLQSQLERVKNLQSPNLDTFKHIAKNHNIKLTGVSQKKKATLQLKNGKGYQLIFTGRIVSILNALDHIESSLALIVESIGMHSNKADEKLVDLELLVTIPEYENVE